MRVLMVLLLSGTLGVLGCETESDDGGPAGSGGSAGSGGTAGSGGMAGAGGTAGDGGTGGMGLPDSGQFCDDFDATCEYGGDNYGNRPDCLVSYEGYSTERKECVVEHLGFAADAPPGDLRDEHCGHASGASPCGPAM